MKCDKCNAPAYRIAFDPQTFNVTYQCPKCGGRFVSDKIEIPKAIKVKKKEGIGNGY